MSPHITEVLPEERLAKLVTVIIKNSDLSRVDVSELAAIISPYLQLEILDAHHHERVLCLTDFYNLRERLMDREREDFKKKSNLIAEIMARPEAKHLGITDAAVGTSGKL